MGVPVSPRNIFPSNIQGLPTWYEVRVNERGYLGRRGGVRPDGGDEPADLGPRPAGDRARRLPAVRQQQADAAVEVPRRHPRDRRAADRDVRHALHRSARAAAAEEHRLRRRAGGAAGHRARGHRHAAGRAVQGQGQAAPAQPRRLHDGPALRPRRARATRSGCAWSGATRSASASSSKATPRPRWAACTAARRCARGIRSRRRRRWPRRSRSTAASTASTRRRGTQQLRHRAGRGRDRVDRHRGRRRLERRARVHRDLGARACR